MKEVAEKALGHWGIDGATVVLIAERENIVFKVSQGQSNFAMRLHRIGYRSHAELRSELSWMAQVARGGISVPAPVPTQTGKMVCDVEGIQVDLLQWLNGETMANALVSLELKGKCQLFYELGRKMARLHQISDAWSKPLDFDRARWDHDGLVGDMPLWNMFWENPGLTSAERELCKDFRKMASAELTQTGPSLDYGLIHADLVPNNVIVEGSKLKLIDFDDGGYGYRLFDIATALLKYLRDPNYTDIRGNLVQGYRSIRPLNVDHLDLHLALRAATYVGWNITRINEPDGAERNKRFINVFGSLASRYLKKSL